MTTATERTAPLASDIRDMLTTELPGLAWLNGNLSLLTVQPSETDPTRIDITLRPVDFQADCVEISVSLRVDAISRVEPEMAAITAGIDV